MQIYRICVHPSAPAVGNRSLFVVVYGTCIRDRHRKNSSDGVSRTVYDDDIVPLIFTGQFQNFAFFGGELWLHQYR